MHPLCRFGCQLLCTIAAAFPVVAAAQLLPSERPTSLEFGEDATFGELRIVSPPGPRGTLIATFGPYTHHRGKGPYNSRAAFRSLEWETPGRWSAGGASFRNSFHQPCSYAFIGKRFILKHHSGRFFAKVTGGIIHGYKAPHRREVPLNVRGFNPAMIPSIGYQYKAVSFQFVVFGLGYGAMPLVGCNLR